MVLNKVDQLDNNVDFARAFGTLGLAGVFPYADDRAIGWHPIGKSMELMWLYVVETC